MSDSSAPAVPAVHRIDPGDDVALALADLVAGSTPRIDGIALQVEDAVPRSHKVALRHFAARAPLRKYGFPNAIASQPNRDGQ